MLSTNNSVTTCYQRVGSKIGFCYKFFPTVNVVKYCVNFGVCVCVCVYSHIQICYH